MSAGDRYSPRLSPEDVREDYDYDRERDIRSRDRSRERHDRRRSNYDDRRDRDDRREDRSHRRRRSRSRQRDERPRRERSPEIPIEDNVDSLESEQRSVFVSQLSTRTNSSDLRRFFQDRLGERSIVDARIVMDKNSRRSKGIGYVEVKTASLIDKALELTGELLNGIPMIVTQSEADKNRQAKASSSLQTQSVQAEEVRRSTKSRDYDNRSSTINPANDPTLYKVYVGSLSYTLKEYDVRSVFEPFGEIEDVELSVDDQNRSKGYAYVKYKRMEDSRMACEQMNRFELAGRTLKVQLVNYYGDPVRMPEQSIENEGLNLNSVSRHELMKTLMRSHDPNAQFEQELAAREKEKKVQERMKTKGVLLKYMFKASEETEAGWEKELAEDVKTECENEYGKVQEIGVDKESEEGEIVVKFYTIESAEDAINGLNGRWFGGRQVKAVNIADKFLKLIKDVVIVDA
ncbi:splicing factor, CC1-like protein [Wallemia mellicola]|nr:splicing factor, CC1-like protein [Wallemia mellicola]